MTVEHPPRTVREAILRAAKECRRIAEEAESAARVAEARGYPRLAIERRHEAQAARDCETAVRRLVSQRAPEKKKP